MPSLSKIHIHPFAMFSRVTHQKVSNYWYLSQWAMLGRMLIGIGGPVSNVSVLQAQKTKSVLARTIFFFSVHLAETKQAAGHLFWAPGRPCFSTLSGNENCAERIEVRGRCGRWRLWRMSSESDNQVCDDIHWVCPEAVRGTKVRDEEANSWGSEIGGVSVKNQGDKCPGWVVALSAALGCAGEE